MIQLSISTVIPILDGDATFAKFVAAGDVLPNPPYASVDDLPEHLRTFVARPETLPLRAGNQFRHQFSYFGTCKFKLP